MLLKNLNTECKSIVQHDTVLIAHKGQIFVLGFLVMLRNLIIFISK